jgi:hypothetical protein
MLESAVRKACRFIGILGRSLMISIKCLLNLDFVKIMLVVETPLDSGNNIK